MLAARWYDAIIDDANALWYFPDLQSDLNAKGRQKFGEGVVSKPVRHFILAHSYSFLSLSQTSRSAVECCHGIVRKSPERIEAKCALHSQRRRARNLKSNSQLIRTKSAASSGNARSRLDTRQTLWRARNGFLNFWPTLPAIRSDCTRWYTQIYATTQSAV